MLEFFRKTARRWWGLGENKLVQRCGWCGDWVMSILGRTDNQTKIEKHKHWWECRPG